MTNRFGEDKRLLCANDYRVVFNGAKWRAGQKDFLLLARTNDHGHHRLGLAVAKKHVRLATRRNRVKRQVREAFRTLPGSLPGLDIVFLTRPGSASSGPGVLSADLPRQLQQLCRKASQAGDDTS
ncbi:MAG: ribonuclease P protein component [Chromatocurvus sp.]